LACVPSIGARGQRAIYDAPDFQHDENYIVLAVATIEDEEDEEEEDESSPRTTTKMRPPPPPWNCPRKRRRPNSPIPA
jgi:hypothetical protein